MERKEGSNQSEAASVAISGFTSIGIRLGLTSSGNGTTTSSVPFLALASIFSASMSFGKINDRANDPYERS